MSKEFHYFKIMGGAVLAAFNRWHEKFEAQQAARRALLVELNASSLLGNNRRIVGVKFNGEPLEGWSSAKDFPGYYKPSGNSKAMKAMREKLAGYSLNGAQEFQAEVLGIDNPFSFMDGQYIRFMAFERIGDIKILLVPNCACGDFKGGWNPPDEFCVPLKNSEYWAIKESPEANNVAYLRPTEA